MIFNDLPDECSYFYTCIFYRILQNCVFIAVILHLNKDKQNNSYVGLRCVTSERSDIKPFLKSQVYDSTRISTKCSNTLNFKQ